MFALLISAMMTPASAAIPSSVITMDKACYQTCAPQAQKDGFDSSVCVDHCAQAVSSESSHGGAKDSDMWGVEEKGQGSYGKDDDMYTSERK